MMPQPRVCDTARMSSDTEDSAPATRDVRALLRLGHEALAGDEAARETELLLMHALGVGRAWLFAHAEEAVETARIDAFLALLARRAAGEPVAYLLGEREFYGLRLQLSAATLIPRPETELLVDLALARLPRRAGLRVLDLGTGSGAIALALAHTRPELQVCASDASAAALAVASANAKALGLGRVEFRQGDWWAPWQDQRFDLAVSNPPYIEDTDPHLAQGDLRFEPRSALASGADGFDDIRRIIESAGDHLQPGGWLLFEHGYEQGQGARRLLQAAGFADVQSWLDLEDRERVSGGCWLQA
jgi:release factor glutamine methyltransferase